MTKKTSGNTWWTHGSLRLPGITCLPSTSAPFLHIHQFCLQSSFGLITFGINNTRAQSECSPGSDEFPKMSPPSTAQQKASCAAAPKTHNVCWPPCTAPHYTPRHWHGYWRHALLRHGTASGLHGAAAAHLTLPRTPRPKSERPPILQPPNLNLNNKPENQAENLQ